MFSEPPLSQRPLHWFLEQDGALRLTLKHKGHMKRSCNRNAFLINIKTIIVQGISFARSDKGKVCRSFLPIDAEIFRSEFGFRDQNVLRKLFLPRFPCGF